MTFCVKLILVFSLFPSGYAATQSDPAGTWQGKLGISPTEKIAV
jgi:hypothetical protein